MPLSISLLDNDVVLSAPFVKVDIGDYEFGVYRRADVGSGYVHIEYPNYIKSLTIDKINGTINQYTLQISYPVTADSDPNFFEKVFSSVSDTRRIVFSYGDFQTPHYIYGNEEALITEVNSDVDVKSAQIRYTVKATGAGILAFGGTHSFPERTAKPSTIIRELINQNKYGLLNLFSGMKDGAKVDTSGLLSVDDKSVKIQAQQMSVLDYIQYLVGCMSPASTGTDGSINSTVYSLVINEDKENLFGGPYFKIQKLERNTNALNELTTYTLDIGYPGANVVIDFHIEDNQGYSILYDYTQKIDSYNAGKRIDDKGNITYVPANYLTNSKQLHLMTEYDKNWWTKVTELPIKVTLTVKGLLRPTLLMQYIKLNVWFYGRKHVSSGYYTIIAQQDTISESGFKTRLTLLRIAPDGDVDAAVGLFGEKVSDQDGSGSSVGGSTGKNNNGSNNYYDESGNFGSISRPRNIHYHIGSSRTHSTVSLDVSAFYDENGITISSGGSSGGGGSSGNVVIKD